MSDLLIPPSLRTLRLPWIRTSRSDDAERKPIREDSLEPRSDGATRIEAVDLLGRELLQSDWAGLVALRERIAATVHLAAAREATADRAASLTDMWEEVDELLDGQQPRGAAPTFEDAAPLLLAFRYGVVAWLGLDQALSELDRADARPREVDHAYDLRRSNSCAPNRSLSGGWRVEAAGLEPREELGRPVDCSGPRRTGEAIAMTALVVEMELDRPAL
jgi:hypothetical protein